jgi:hypothetical protein
MRVPSTDSSQYGVRIYEYELCSGAATTRVMSRRTESFNR